MGVNDVIHDELITQDIKLRRITGDCQNRAERRLDRLGRDLKALAVRIDPNGTSRTDARQRRLARLEEESRKLVNEAYAEIAAENRKDLRRVAKIESEATVQVIGKALP